MNVKQVHKHWLTFVSLCLVCCFGIMPEAAAQTSGTSLTVTGVVRDEATNEPLPGVQVWIKDSPNGTLTDIDGHYSLKYTTKNAILCFSFIGYDNIEMPLNGRDQTIDVAFKESGIALDEMVVVGYGTQKKASVVGAISSIAPTQLTAPVAKISQMLGGQLAGVISYQSSGEPGTGSNFWVRGVSSFSGNTSPLVLVDGIERSLDLVDPNDIKEFSVLKDASATAIYGVRGANGVILVTTRAGEESKRNISVRYETGVVAPTLVPETVNSLQFAEMYNEAMQFKYYSDEAMEAFRTGSNPDLYPNVDWMDEIFKSVTTNHRANVSITGGSNMVKYYISGGLYTEGGLFNEDSSLNYGTGMNYSRYNFRSNIDIKLEKNTTLNLNLATIFEQRNKPGTDSGSIFQYALQVPSSVFPVRYSTGELAGPGTSTGNNPYALATETGYRQVFDNNAQALVGLTHDFGWLLKGLKANMKYSFDAYNGHHLNHTRTPDHYGNPSYDEEGNLQLTQFTTGSQTLGYGRASYGNRRIYLEGSLNYANSFGKHNVSALLLHQQSSLNYVGDNATNSQASLPYRNIGVAGRLTYDYDYRYFLELNAGYNGSENFAPGKRFGFFPALSAGWLVSEEAWWGEKLKDVVDMFKIRGSWGKVGNDDIGGSRRFIYLGTITGGRSANFGTGYKSYGGIKLGEVANPLVGWEEAEKINLGVDVSLFNKLKIQADIFKENRTGIFVNRNSIPYASGISVTPTVNLGKMNNSGLDMSMDYNQRVGDVQLTAKGTFTYARNVIVDQDEAPWTEPYLNRTGQSNWQKYGYVSDGLFQDWDDINSHTDQSVFSPQPGDIKYVDLNNDGVISELDQKAIGWRDIPEIIYGLGATAEWKGFDFSFFFQGVDHISFSINNSLVRGFSSWNDNIVNANVLQDVYGNYWTENRKDAKYPRLTMGTSQNNEQGSDYWMKDGSYIRLKNVEFGYTLPKKWTLHAGVKGVRIYAQAHNLLTFSSFKLWDPDLRYGAANYPTTRVISLGISTSF